MKLSVVIFALLPGIAAADGWQRLLDDAAITEALAGQVVVYDAYTRQYFGPNGATQYFTALYLMGWVMALTILVALISIRSAMIFGPGQTGRRSGPSAGRVRIIPRVLIIHRLSLEAAAPIGS